MAGYRVIIRGHLDQKKRPAKGWGSIGIPEDPRQVFHVDAPSESHLNNFIDARMADIIGCNGMKAELDPDNKDLTKIRPWVAIPMSTLTHISFEFTLMAGELPVFYKDKGTLNPSGKKAQVN